MTFHSKYRKTLSDYFWQALGGAYKNRTGTEFDNSLHYAALTGKTWRADFLIRERQAKVASSENFALRWAANGGHLEMLRLLIGQGADVNAKEGEALTRALGKGHEAAALLLLDHGADPSLHDCKALHLAHDGGFLPVLKKMLASGTLPQREIRALLERAREKQNHALTALYENYVEAPPFGAPPPKI